MEYLKNVFLGPTQSFATLWEKHVHWQLTSGVAITSKTLCLVFSFINCNFCAKWNILPLTRYIEHSLFCKVHLITKSFFAYPPFYFKNTFANKNVLDVVAKPMFTFSKHVFLRVGLLSMATINGFILLATGLARPCHSITWLHLS